MTASHRTWLPFILIGLIVALVLALFAWYRPTASEPVPDQGPNTNISVSSVSFEEYQSSVAQIISEYLSSRNARVAYSALVGLSVPGSARPTHLELVIIMGKYRDGQTDEASGRYDALKSQTPWLP